MYYNLVVNFLKYFDGFPAQISFGIGGKRQYKSILGGTMYMCLLLICFVYVVYALTIFFGRQLYNSSYSTQISEYPIVNMTKKVMFALGVHDSSYTFNETLSNNMQIKMVLQKWNGSNVFEEELSFQKCTKMNFEKISNESFNDLQLYNYICPAYGNKSFNLINLESNTILNQACVIVGLKNKTLSKFNPEPILSINFYDTAITFDDFDNYITKYFNTYFYSVKESKQSYNYYFSNIYFYTDSNWLWRDKVLTSDVIIERDGINNNYYNDDFLFQFNLFASQKYYTYSRTYQKLPDLVANIAGMFSQIVVIVNCVCVYVNDKKSKNKLLKATFDITKDHQINVNNFCQKHIRLKAGSDETAKKQTEIFDQISVSKNSKRSREIYKNFGKRIERYAQKIAVTPMSISICKLPDISFTSVDVPSLNFKNKKLFKKSKTDLYCSCCKKTPKYDKKLKLVEDQIENYLDSVTYIKKMHEIDVLKNILLTKEQKKIFNFISTPAINLRDENNILKIPQDSLDLSSLECLNNCYELLSNHDEKSHIDKKLISALDLNVENLQKIYKN